MSKSFLCMSLTEGQEVDYLRCVNRRRLADFERIRSFSAVPMVMRDCYLAMEEPVPNPALSSLKALYFFFPSPGEFCSTAKELLDFFFTSVFFAYLLFWYVRSS